MQLDIDHRDDTHAVCVHYVECIVHEYCGDYEHSMFLKILSEAAFHQWKICVAYLSQNCQYSRKVVVGTTLVQIMAKCLWGTKKLQEPMLTYWQLGPSEQGPVKFESKYNHFWWKLMRLKVSPAKWQRFCPYFHAWKPAIPYKGIRFAFTGWDLITSLVI